MIDAYRSQLIQALWEIEVSHRKFLLMDHLSFLNSDHPHFRGEVETRRNSISKKGDCDLHTCKVEEQERCQKAER
jgi:hypothetical protein